MITGLTSGVFDLFHFSHLLYLQRCRAQCDKLIVGVDSDELVRRTKDPRRPIIPEKERLELVASMGVVYKAFILRNVEDLEGVAKRFKVKKVFKHESFWDIKNVYGVQHTGAELVIIPDIDDMTSTTKIIGRIMERYGPRLCGR